MNWRAWLHSQLTESEETTWPVHGSASLSRRPAVQFLAITFMPSLPGPFPGAQVLRVQVWAHDVAGSYVAIDRELENVRKVLRRATAEQEFISANWEGDSNDLEDDAMETRTRYAMFRLSGKENE